MFNEIQKIEAAARMSMGTFAEQDAQAPSAEHTFVFVLVGLAGFFAVASTYIALVA